VIVQIIAADGDFQERIARLFKADPLHYRKIRSSDLPPDWDLVTEKFLTQKDFEQIEPLLRKQIRRVLVQEILAVHVKLKIIYYNCKTREAAQEVALLLQDERDDFQKWTIESEGTTAVAAISQDEELNRQALGLINW